MSKTIIFRFPQKEQLKDYEAKGGGQTKTTSFSDKVAEKSMETNPHAPDPYVGEHIHQYF